MSSASSNSGRLGRPVSAYPSRKEKRGWSKEHVSSTSGCTTFVAGIGGRKMGNTTGVDTSPSASTEASSLSRGGTASSTSSAIASGSTCGTASDSTAGSSLQVGSLTEDKTPKSLLPEDIKSYRRIPDAQTLLLRCSYGVCTAATTSTRHPDTGFCELCQQQYERNDHKILPSLAKLIDKEGLHPCSVCNQTLGAPKSNNVGSSLCADCTMTQRASVNGTIPPFILHGELGLLSRVDINEMLRENGMVEDTAVHLIADFSQKMEEFTRSEFYAKWRKMSGGMSSGEMEVFAELARGAMRIFYDGDRPDETAAVSFNTPIRCSTAAMKNLTITEGMTRFFDDLLQPLDFTTPVYYIFSTRPQSLLCDWVVNQCLTSQKHDSLFPIAVTHAPDDAPITTASEFFAKVLYSATFRQHRAEDQEALTFGKFLDRFTFTRKGLTLRLFKRLMIRTWCIYEAHVDREIIVVVDQADRLLSDLSGRERRLLSMVMACEEDVGIKFVFCGSSKCALVTDSAGGRYGGVLQI